MAATPDTVMKDGGTIVTVDSIVENDGTFRVHFGPNGDTTDPICYSGISGNAEVVELSNQIFSCVLPPIDIGGPYFFHAVRLSGTGNATFTTGALVTVVAHDFKSRVLRYRGLLPRTWLTGYRTTEQEVFPQ